MSPWKARIPRSTSLRAVREAVVERRAAAQAQVDEIKAFYGVREQCLETMLLADAGAA